MLIITGATGHIGNVLVRELLSQGEKVRALLLYGEDRGPLEGQNVEIVEGDVLDPKSLVQAFSDIDTVYHLAGLITILPGENELVKLVNVKGTQNVIEAAIKTGVRRVVYTSSIHAISRAPVGVTIDERLPFDTANHYGVYDKTKAEASAFVQEAARKGLVDAVIVCPTGVIGPFDYRRSEMGQLILDCVSQRPQMYVDGAYDFVDVRDVAVGLVLAGKHGKSGESYILSGERVTVKGLMLSLRQITGRFFVMMWAPFWFAYFASLFTPMFCKLFKLKPRFTPYSLEVLRSNSSISNSKARLELGFAPRPLLDSLKDTVRWTLENRKRRKMKLA